MSEQLEDRIGDELERRLAEVGRSPGDLGVVLRQGSRLRRRRRTTVSAAALAVGVVVVTGAVLARGGDDQRVDPAPPPIPVGGTWTEVATAPFAPRYDPVAAWTGSEVVVVGGGIEPPCPPAASCVEADVYSRDAAAYDVDADSWRTLPDAPVDVGPGFALYAADGRLVLTDGSWGYGRHWSVYDVATERWSDLPRPPSRVVAPGGVLDGEVWELAADGSLLVLDPVAGSWRRMAGSTVQPALDVSGLTVTDDGVYVTGTDPDAPDDGDTPVFAEVDRLGADGWERLPVTGQIAAGWHWTGERLVAVDPQVATGLTGLPPYGGVLDVDTGEWAPLPNAPDVESGEGFDPDSWSVSAADGPLVLGWRSVYDDRTGTWTPQGRPDGTTVDSSQAAVWAGDRLVVVGGLDEETGYTDVSGLSNQAWVWTPRR